jgi:hypothetical protein
MKSLTAAVMFTLAGLAAAPAAAQLAVTSFTPTRNNPSVPRSASITLTFDRPLNPATVTNANVRAFGKVRGPIAAALTLSNSNRTITLDPTSDFAAGEGVMVMVSRNLRSFDNIAMRNAGYAFEFIAAANNQPHRFEHVTNVSNRGTPPEQTRIYGGVAADFNRDGLTDIGTINEVSADLRMFMGNGNPAMPFTSMLTPYLPLPEESSPNAIADFDGDGFIDLVTASYDSRVAVAFGNGDGTFDPAQILTVSAVPRDIGILDADGDGDQDFVVVCSNGDSVDFVRNNGSRTFATPVATPVSGGPYGMAVGDFNNDGIIDLAAGCRNTSEAKVLRGNGDGSFTLVHTRPIGGTTWVVVAGDLNNDGNLDITAANSFSNNGSVLLGNGNGTLQAATAYASGGHTVSTDLADLDGDGDLDWILSSFGAGRWYTFLNNGAGSFTPNDEFVAPNNPSCAIPTDWDNDGDIDLVLTDEIADVLVLKRNVPRCDSIDFNQDGLFPDDNDLVDFLSVLAGGACSTGTCSDIDFNNDGLFPDDNDLIAFLTVLAGGVC